MQAGSTEISDRPADAYGDDAPGLVLEGVLWEFYLGLRDPEENGHIRMSYLDATLILMSPQYTFEVIAADPTTKILEASDAGATDAHDDETPGMVLEGISWETYVGLRDLEENDHIRMTYLDGTLILMSPQFIHDRGAWRLGLLVCHVAEALAIDVAGTGNTTFRRGGRGKRKGTGKEPDNAFYVGANESRIRNKDTIDLTVDPPPDLAIEVDNKRDSRVALKIYARLGVPEVWRFHAPKRTLWFGRLVGEGYETIDMSLCLPVLTPALVLEALGVAQGPDMSDTRWLGWLREWARGLPVPPRAGENR